MKERTIWRALAFGAALVPITDLAAQTDDLDVFADVPFDGESDLVPLFLAVTINGLETGLVAEFEATLDGGNMRAPRSELKELGIKPPGGTGERVALSRIEGLSYVYDEESQTVHISLPHQSLYPHKVSAAYNQPFENPDKTVGAALNYSLIGQHSRSLETGTHLGAFSANLEGWVFSPFGRLSSTGFYSRALDGKTKEGKFLRLESALTFDLPEKAVSVTLGDFQTRGPVWSRSIRMAGAEVRRDFSLRSDLVTQQRLSFDGAAAVPSSVDVFIENSRVYAGEVEDGPFRLEDVPISGRGDAEIVIRGIDGTVRRKNVSFFSSNALLKRGTADYSLAAGHAREDFGQVSDSYGERSIVTGSMRYGLTEKLTVEGSFSASEDHAVWGIGLTAVPLSLGEFSVAAAQSEFRGDFGNFLHVGLRTAIAGIDIATSTTRTDPGFADLAYVTGLDYLGDTITTTGSLLEVPLQQDVVSLSIPVSRKNHKIGLSYINARRENSDDQLASISFGSPLAKGRSSFSVNGTYNFATEDYRISAGFSWKLGKRKHVQASAYTDHTGRDVQDVSLRRAMGEGPGEYGYQVHLARRDNSMPMRAKGEYRGSYGLVSADAQLTEDSLYLRSQVDGALAMTGGALAMGNPIDDSFAVVDVGVSKVPVYIDNRPAARTNAQGRVLVTGLNSFRHNRVSVNVRDLPENATLGVTAAEVVPARGSGHYLSFEGHEQGGVLVIVKGTGGSELPAGTPVKVNRGGESFVGYEGETWIEEPRPANLLMLSLENGATCTARFAYHAAADVIGPVECL